MYRHFTDPNGPNGIVDSDIRLDIPSVRKLISTGGVGKIFFIIIFVAIKFFIKPWKDSLNMNIRICLSLLVSYKSLPASLKPDNILIARSLGMEDESPSGTISGSRASRLRRFETATGFEVQFDLINMADLWCFLQGSSDFQITRKLEKFSKEAFSQKSCGVHHWDTSLTLKNYFKVEETLK